MLQLKNIRKSYITGDFVQVALKDISISFRDNEFAAILGPSGSGKTTLLNIVGGLDHYDSGDLIIDGISTKDYKDKDWDTFRNNRVGFVFQSYNLIPHQTILANVELALTLSGVDREERRQRAKEALERVGLGDHINKKPSQLSGGQMQRVAIARALINDPEIVLADEPTGALDSKTSIQIMDLLTEIAKDRLVVMVTHNPELADEYATRIVNLADGEILNDTDPYEPTAADLEKISDKPIRRASMNFLTALSLSFNNLMTKKGRTIMTAFAGSIGIIGIAAILALANGVNSYIASVEEETLSLYPLEISSQGFDMTAMMVGSMGVGDVSPDGGSDDGGSDSNSDGGTSGNTEQATSNDADHPLSRANSQEDTRTVNEAPIVTRMFTSIGSNDLESLKKYLEGEGSEIDQYVNAIDYSYNVTPQIFSADTSDGVHQINPDTTFSMLGIGSGTSGNAMMSSMMSTNMFGEMMDRSMVEEQYQLKAGHWPEKYNECILVLTENGSVSDFLMYVLGLRDHAILEELVKQFANEEEIIIEEDSRRFTYSDFLDLKMKLVNSADYYKYDEIYDIWVDKSDDRDYMKDLVDNGEELRIVGIVQADPDSKTHALSSGIYYTPELITHLIDQSAEKQIVKDQLADSTVDVFTGKPFADEEDDESDFDMSELFTVDTGAIEAAFKFDESKMSLDLDSLDIDFDSMTLPEMDMSSMEGMDLNLGDMDLGNMDFDMSDMGNIDMSDIDMGNLDIDMPQMQPNQQVLGEMIGAIGNDFMAKLMMNPSPLQGNTPVEKLQWYLANDPEAQRLLAEYMPKLFDMEGMMTQLQTQIQQAMAQQMGNMSTAIQSQISKAMESQMSEIQGKISSAIESNLKDAMSTYMTDVMSELSTQMQDSITQAMEKSMSQLSSNMADAMSIDEEAFKNAFQMNMDEDDITDLIMSMMSGEERSYDNNLAKLNYANLDKPYEIDIFAKDFNSKQEVITILDEYNDRMKAEDQEDKEITYTDIVGALMSSVTTIVDMISYVLIAFVSISLVVSSIMIGVITYISVLERKKEIGILRAIGASKSNISQVFNAETVIEGLISGVLGVGITALVCIPVSAVIYALFDVPNVASLPIQAAIILILISVALTFVAGLIPASSASRKDPVEALRSE